MKPALADDVTVESAPLPAGVQPKIDGVRALNFTGTLTGRSLDFFPGFGVTERFSRQPYVGLDGEMTVGADPMAEGLCSATHGALAAFKGVTRMADFHWWVFDFLTPETVELPYVDRYEILSLKVQRLRDERIHLVPMDIVRNRGDLAKKALDHVMLGYEGTITRNLGAPHKEGRPNKAIMQIGRIKTWVTAEMLVTEVHEGSQNLNEPKINSLGKMERSSSIAGKIANGKIGALSGTLLKDLYHPITQKFLKRKGELVRVGAGEMSASERAMWFHNQDQIVGHIITFQFQPHGMQEELRMPTYKSRRLRQDLGE